MSKYLTFYSIGVLILLVGCEPNKDPYESELNIYNQLFDSLYSVEYCSGLYRPRQKFYNDSNSFNNDLRKYFSDKKEFFNKLDSLQLIIYVYDTLTETRVKNDYHHILKVLKNYNDTLFNVFPFFTSLNTSKRNFCIDSLFQENIHFRNARIDTLSEEDDFPFGFYKNEYRIGFIHFSRIIMDYSKTMGIFYFYFKGGIRCAYGEYVLIYKKENTWKIYKRILFEIE